MFKNLGGRNMHNYYKLFSLLLILTYVSIGIGQDLKAVNKGSLIKSELTESDDFATEQVEDDTLPELGKCFVDPKTGELEAGGDFCANIPNPKDPNCNIYPYASQDRTTKEYWCECIPRCFVSF
jgi:hypothetical protein